jgi:hypothetical protein
VHDNVAIASVLEQGPNLWDATKGAHVFSIVPAFLSGRRFVFAA